MTIAEQFARFIFALDFEDLPSKAVETAKRCVIDGTAAILAGSTEPCSDILRQYATVSGGHPEATTLGVDSIRVPLQTAALINGTAGHALDWDDTALSREPDRSVLIHPTMQPLCVCYAISEMTGASGRDFLTAFVAGFEVQVKIAEAINADHFTGKRGFHTSGTIGVFGAAAAAARLMGLTVQEIVHALAIAATMSSGIGVNHGAMAKPLNMGLAAQNGMAAARMAKLGFDGKSNAFEGGRGFFEAFGGGFNPLKIEGRLGDPFAILDPGPSIKPYPSGVVGHPGMDAMLELVIKHNLVPEDVGRIEVRTGDNTITPGPLRIMHARTALEAKFCVPFQMACILVRRKAGLAEFSDEFVASDEVQSLQRRVETVVAPEITALGKDKVVFEITVHTHDGRVLKGRSPEHYRGGPRNPLSWESLCSKFRDASAKVLDTSSQRKFLTDAARLDELDAAKILIDSVIRA